jgi:hypothetical protein
LVVVVVVVVVEEKKKKLKSLSGVKSIGACSRPLTTTQCRDIQGPLEKYVDWRQCAAVMQREVVTVMPSCSGGGNVVVA